MIAQDKRNLNNKVIQQTSASFGCSRRFQSLSYLYPCSDGFNAYLLSPFIKWYCPYIATLY